jgi:AcrR family transcriptional regulator
MSNMPKRSQRRYRSAHREEQAEQTRRRIEDAAYRLFLRKGVDETTIQAIAREAGVAAPTIYAVFKSKRGIVERLIERAAFTPAYDALVREALGSHDPATRLRYAARICRGICDSLRGQSKLLRAASAIAPDLMRDKERMRFERQSGLVDLLALSNALRPGVRGARHSVDAHEPRHLSEPGGGAALELATLRRLARRHAGLRTAET